MSQWLNADWEIPSFAAALVKLRNGGECEDIVKIFALHL
jgi:hypothetical protein